MPDLKHQDYQRGLGIVLSRLSSSLMIAHFDGLCNLLGFDSNSAPI